MDTKLQKDVILTRMGIVNGKNARKIKIDLFTACSLLALRFPYHPIPPTHPEHHSPKPGLNLRHPVIRAFDLVGGEDRDTLADHIRGNDHRVKSHIVGGARWCAMKRPAATDDDVAGVQRDILPLGHVMDLLGYPRDSAGNTGAPLVWRERQ